MVATVVITAPERNRLALLADLTAQAADYQRASKSPATLRAYRADWRDFTAWCASHGLVSLPASPDTLAGYLADLARHGAKVSTIGRRLSGISVAHQAAGLDSPTHDKVTRATMQGIRRTLGTAPTRKRALLTDDLRRMLAHLDGSGPGGQLGALRDRALLLIGFASGMRRSEIASLDVADVAETADGLTVTLRRSKTDQEAAGRTIGVCRGRHPDTDPVDALRAWLDGAAITQGPIFRAVQNGRVSDRRICDRYVARLIQRLAALAGLDAPAFGGHSLRAGFVTQAANGGARERDIMRSTGHHSTAILRGYIRDGRLFRDNASAVLGL